MDQLTLTLHKTKDTKKKVVYGTKDGAVIQSVYIDKDALGDVPPAEPFAKDMGYDGPPFIWDEEERRHLRARLDALYFHLYGISREDADYILSTFPIIKREDEKEFKTYRTRDLVLGYMNALEAGDTESKVAG